MPPLGCALFSIIAAVLFAVGGQMATYAAQGLALIGFVFAGMSMPDPFVRHKGAWMAGSMLGRPLLMMSGLELAGLSDGEMMAIMAHELGHATIRDRIWRMVGGMVGACTIPAIAGGLLTRGIPSDPLLFFALAVGSLPAALVQFWSMQCSERRADRFAIASIGKVAIADLWSAKRKLLSQAQEQRGLLPHERGKTPAKLKESYLRELGGMTAVLHPLLTREEAATPKRIGKDEWKWPTQEGQFVFGLVDGRRTVADIIASASLKSRSLDAFATIRLLHQFLQSKLIR
jgi:hypothetical protein